MVNRCNSSSLNTTKDTAVQNVFFMVMQSHFPSFMVLEIFRTESTDTDNLNHRENIWQDYLQLITGTREL